jgi:type III pantothenate kinase
MKPDAVVDVGNSRIKWGLRDPARSRIAQHVALADDPVAWQIQRVEWQATGLLPAHPLWLLASVQPHRCGRLSRWLQGQGDRVEQLELAAQLPLSVALEKPDHVGIDRLLNAVAAKRVLPPGRPAILVDAGSAVTVDWLDPTHAFRGGAIFPGLRLMAEALHRHTALLPLVTVSAAIPEMPGTATIPAMQAGIFWAVVGGIDRAARRLCRLAQAEPKLFLTGGDASLLLDALAAQPEAALTSLEPTLWREQTLEGILASAEALP